MLKLVGLAPNAQPSMVTAGSSAGLGTRMRQPRARTSSGDRIATSSNNGSRSSRLGNVAVVASPPGPRPFAAPSPVVSVSLVNLHDDSKAELGSNGTSRNGRSLALGELYLSDLSAIRVLELVNMKPRRLHLQLNVELRKPFHESLCAFQLDNENVSLLHSQQQQQPRDAPNGLDEFNHMPPSVVRVSAMSALCAENLDLSEGYNELFNHIGTVNEVVLEPNEVKRVIFSVRAFITAQANANNSSSQAADSSEEERMHLSETSCLMLTGRLVLQPRYDGLNPSDAQPKQLPAAPDVVIPIQGQVCRSLLRLDVKELHFDDCVPGGSFVKDFTVWNRSEIPLLFKLVSSLSAFADTKELITCTDYNSGYVIGEKTLHAAAYGHVRIRVTYRPKEVGERFFEIQAQNLHDARNVKILKVHAITNKEHHREGLSIKEPSGSYLMSGSKLDFGDCYTGVANSKVLTIRNTTEAPLYVELTSDRPKEVTFELKLQQNRARNSRAPRAEDVLSPTDSNAGSSRKGSLSPDGSKTLMSFSSLDGANNYGLDSDEEADENEVDFYEDEFQPNKRLSFEESPMGDPDDADDDFEFDRGEPAVVQKSPPVSPKTRSSRAMEMRRRAFRTKGKKTAKIPSRLRDLAYESGVDSGNSMCSSPERKSRGEMLRRQPSSIEDNNGSNFLVETIDLAPGAERTIFIWYCPASNSSVETVVGDNLDGIDLKGCRLMKQTFRVSFRCFQIQGSWQQAQSRVYDRTLGKSIHIRARTCTSIVTASPSILHLGDCNIGELKSSSCILTNHSELPTVVKPIVTSKVISTVPNDEMTLGPKQSTELKIEIIPRKTNPNYSRLISIMNAKNKSNIPQICVRSSNMDAHHVIYHSMFYKLITQSRSAFLNFDHVAINSIGIQVFDLENFTNAPLHLNLQSSDLSRVRLYCMKTSFSDVTKEHNEDSQNGAKAVHPFFSTASLNALTGVGSKYSNASSGLPNASPSATFNRSSSRVVRRRRSFGSIAELNNIPSASKKNTSVLRSYLNKKPNNLSGYTTPTRSSASIPSAGLNQIELVKNRTDQAPHLSPVQGGIVTKSHQQSAIQDAVSALSSSLQGSDAVASNSHALQELTSLLHLFERSRSESERYCHGSIPSPEMEQEIVGMVRERIRRFQALLAEKRIVPLNNNKERNIRIAPKSQVRILAVLSPAPDHANSDGRKMRMEKHKVFITLPPGGNKKAVADASKFDQNKAPWATSKHPFDSRPSVRELLLKSRVCRSVMNVNQKNINFGRIAASSKSSKKLVVQNMSAIPLIYMVEKTGSISSGFLEIKEGEMGVVKPFGTKEICFEFQPTLAGPFEEKLKIVNVQDVENSVSVTIKARVVKRETFKLVQSGQIISLGKCLVGEKTEEVKVVVRNTSRKKREYVIQLDPHFSTSALQPTFYFTVDETPSAIITQAQEKKLDEELEKLEHKLRIAVTKKKTDKIFKLNAKISRTKALLSGEQLPDENASETDSTMWASTTASSESGGNDVYDSNSESEYSESESAPRSRRKSKTSGSSGLGSEGFTQTANSLHFSLEAEATGRIKAYAVFHTAQPNGDPDYVEPVKRSGLKSQKAKKRQIRRDSTPVMGLGKFLLFEQQNKDVVKELQYSAEIYSRTAAGEVAYCRAVGKPMQNLEDSGPSKGNLRLMSTEREATETESVVSSGSSLHMTPLELGSTKSDSSAGRRHGLTIAIPESNALVTGDRLRVEALPSQIGTSRPSALLIPIEEAPSDSDGWKLSISNRSGLDKKFKAVELVWNPADSIKDLLSLACEILPEDATESTMTNYEPNLTCLPRKINLVDDDVATVQIKWAFAPRAGFGASSSLSSCITRSLVEKILSAGELRVGTIDIIAADDTLSGIGTDDMITRQPIAQVDIALVKTVQRSLYLDSDQIDLGTQELNSEARGQLVIRNRSLQSTNFLLLVAPKRDDAIASIQNPAGEISFETSTGKVQPGSVAVVWFTFKAVTPGQHTELILLRNLNDRLDTSEITVTVRVTRPVYVRIPELDPHATGNLNVLDFGPCYVTPEMQDTTIESPNVSLKFSKVHKLTLESKVDETLVICTSSNLKTQCYVYEDARLHREATHAILHGLKTIDLFVAIRPRLSADAFKTGASRDLVGGIRLQLFRATELSEIPGEDAKSNMVAEFTVKFVGVAGASLARVTPSVIDFGVEYNSGRLQTCKTHEGRFELVNINKALPLRYRLFVTNGKSGYSDDDETLHVALKHEKGEIAPGGTGEVEFRLMAYTNGLFRRRILVENIHYPGKINVVDVVLFVDTGALHCDIFQLKAHSSITEEPTVMPIALEKNEPISESIDIGVVNVIRLEEEFNDAASVSTVDMDSTARKYRIFEGCSFGDTFYNGLYMLNNTSTRNKFVVVTNKTEIEMMLRPVSTLPLIFQWNHWNGVSSLPVISEGEMDLQVVGSSGEGVAYLDAIDQCCAQGADTASLYCGNSYILPPNSSCALALCFASIAMTNPLPCEVIDSGRLHPFNGMIGIQSVGTEEACTLKVINLSGAFGESRIKVVEKHVSLGKIGYAIGWTSSKFEVTVKNASGVPVFFAISNASSSICIQDVKGAQRMQFEPDDKQSNGSNYLAQADIEESNDRIPTLRSLAMRADQNRNGEGSSIWRLEPTSSSTVEIEFIHTTETFASGIYEFPLRFMNLNNPHNIESVDVHAQIISSYAELVVNPESTGFGAVELSESSAHVAFLPPVTVPPPPNAPPYGSSFWFTLRNVYDEEISVQLAAHATKSLESMFELALISRSSNAPLSVVQIAPDESVDVRVVCRVLPSARFTDRIWEVADPNGIDELGKVLLNVNVKEAKDTAQKQEIAVRGKLIPGRTFTLSASSLHFFGMATSIPTDIVPPSLTSKMGLNRDAAASNETVVHVLRNAMESFWIRNSSTLEPLNFAIDHFAMQQPGLCLVQGSSISEMCALSEYVQAVATPSSGSIPPGESMQILVRLEESSSLPGSEMSSLLESGDSTNPKSSSLLRRMRHHPSWRSNSWGSDMLDTLAEENGSNHMFLTVRDVDMSPETGVTSEVDVHLVLQQNASGLPMPTDGGIQANNVDVSLIRAAFAAREQRLGISSKKLYLAPSLSTHLEEPREQADLATLDNFEEFDVRSIRSGSVAQINQLPVLAIRGCTPVENSLLEGTRFVIDVGQHTVRNGGEVEWEITIESMYNILEDSVGMDPVEYRLVLVDKNAKSWLQLSRDRGTLDRARSYQSVVLCFRREVVGVYSTFLMLQNLVNPSDLKVINVRLEVIADLNWLRSMSTGVDPTANLFRVLVSNHNSLKRQRRLSQEYISNAASASGLVIDYSEVYYHKLYHNHSIVLENSSELSLDFMLSSNARPQEISFCASPTSFNEVSTITLGAHARVQVFLHFRPQPKPAAMMTGEAEYDVDASEQWAREIEVYVNCRLVKDFRETVLLRAICHQPQLTVHVAMNKSDDVLTKAQASSLFLSSQSNFLGLVFSMPEATLSNQDLAVTASTGMEQYLVVQNTRSDAQARIALRNDSMFFNVAVDETLTPAGSFQADYLEHGVCAGRRSTLLVNIHPHSSVIFRVTPDITLLWKHHQLWDHSIKEHITLYNMKQFAEHYQVTLCFTCSNVASFYIPPNVAESYPFSALEDTVVKFLQNYNYTWKWLINYHGKDAGSEDIDHRLTRSSSIPNSASHLAHVLENLENALEVASPLSPRKSVGSPSFEDGPKLQIDTSAGRETQHQVLQSYRALYFDFYYITDELVWYGVRGNASRHSLMLADLAYGVVFNHEVFRSFLVANSSSTSQENDEPPVVTPRLLLPWVRQLGHFLSFFPENQEATLPLRQLADQLRRLELASA